MKKFHANKIILAVTLGIMILAPLRSFAVWGVGDETQDPADIGVNSNTSAQSTLQTVDQYFGYLKTFGLDGLAYSLAQKASQKLVSSVLNAVNGGASANKPPNYVANYASYFASLGGKTTTNYYNSLQYSNNPFAKGIANGIVNTNSGFVPSGLNAFNLNTILKNGTSWQSAGGNLSNAGIQGFDFYTALALPQNTPGGSNLVAQQQLNQNLAMANNIAKVQLTSSGYKAQTTPGTATGIFAGVGTVGGVNTNATVNGINKTVATSNAKTLATNTAAATAAEHGSGTAEVTYADGSVISNGEYYDSSGEAVGTVGSDGNIYGFDGSLMGSSQAGQNGLPYGITDTGNTGAATGDGSDTSNLTGDQSINFNSSDTSLSFDTSNVGSNVLNPSVEDYSGVSDVGANITTPSGTTANTVNNATQEAPKRLQNSNQFFELVFSTLTQMVTGLINKGISSLRSDAGQQSQYQYGSPASINGNANGQNGSWLTGPQTIIDFRNDLDTANQLTALDVQYNENILNMLKAPVTGQVLDSGQIAAGLPASQGTSDVLEQLEACIPGPDTGWDTRLQSYTDAQLKATQNRSNGDSNDATNNARAYKIVEQEIQFATEEEQERIDNPFLNIPAATEMDTIASNFYANAQKFQATFTTLLLKRQVSLQLATIVAQAKAFMPSLVLFDDQWQKMTQDQKNALYAQLTPQIITDSAAGDFTNNYTTTDANGNTILTPLPGDPGYTSATATTAAVSQVSMTGTATLGPTTTSPVISGTLSTTSSVGRDAAMEQRVLDEEWQVWETDTTHMTEAQRQTLYGQFASIENNITDATSLQATETTMNSVQQQNTDLADALHDCLLIRTATQNYQQYPDDAAWDTFKQGLYSDAIRTAFDPSTSIIAVANGTAGIDFSKEGEITLPLDGGNGDLPTGDFKNLAAYIVSSVPSGPPLPPNIAALPNSSKVINAATASAMALAGLLDTTDDPAITPYMNWVDASNFNQLQVQPAVPLTIDTGRSMNYGARTDDTEIGTSNVISTFFQEDADGTLFCRLPAYTLDYWIPTGLTGQPVGCFPETIGGFSSSHGFSTSVKGTNANWYHTNRAQIYYTFVNTNNF